jgi:hypothetical protein
VALQLIYMTISRLLNWGVLLARCPAKGKIPSCCDTCKRARKREADRAYQAANRERHNATTLRYYRRSRKPRPIRTCCDCNLSFDKPALDDP